MTPSESKPFCEGYERAPFRALCQSFPTGEAYHADSFLVEWGPVFHRGRLDGSARVFILALAPARMELVARRNMVGVDGPRMQGFLAKLGITRSYVMINTYLYGIARAKQIQEHGQHEAIVAYRHAWMDALIGERIEAVISLGNRAEEAWQQWKSTLAGARVNPLHVNMTHPTQPESASRGDEKRHAGAMAAMLEHWNQAISQLRQAVRSVDEPPQAKLYGSALTADDLQPIPSFDLPAGLPDWMRQGESFAHRRGETADEKRRSILVTRPGLDH